MIKRNYLFILYKEYKERNKKHINKNENLLIFKTYTFSIEKVEELINVH